MKRLALALAAVALVGACRSAKPDTQNAPPAPAPIAADPHAGHAHAADSSAAGTAPPGYAPITVDSASADAMGLATAAVEEVELTKTLRTAGVVALDETRSAHVHAKVRGWIDGISVDFVGRKVRAGEPLCSIYSQDVYAAEVEFLSIFDRTARAAAPSGEFADAEKRAQEQLLAAARRRLSLWDVPKGEIERLQATREPRRTFPLLAPRDGVVVAKEAIEGMYVEPSLELYTLSDLSRVWVLVDVYETDVPYVHVGDHASLSVEGVEKPIDASVAFLAPTIDESTRTLKARFELANAGNTLRPGAFVSAEMRLDLGKGLAIPESAVIRTGTRAIVFVAHGEHDESPVGEHEARHLMPREVKLGPLVGDRYRVDEGLTVGERVATGAQFLLDSESRLRATSGEGGGHAHPH